MFNSEYSQVIGILQERLGYIFHNPALLILALVHPSFHQGSPGYSIELADYLQSACITGKVFIEAEEGGNVAKLNNQRLEFIGDSALNLVLADLLYARFAELDEGKLSIVLANLVNGSQLAAIGRDLGLGQHLIMDKGEEISGGRNSSGNLENTLEAICGAVFCDGGYAAIRAVGIKLWKDLLEKPLINLEQKDNKSRLQEYAQQLGFALPNYKVLAMTGPAHAPNFRVRVQLYPAKNWQFTEGMIEKNQPLYKALGLLEWMEKSKSLVNNAEIAALAGLWPEISAEAEGSTRKLAERKAAKILLDKLLEQECAST